MLRFGLATKTNQPCTGLHISAVRKRFNIHTHEYNIFGLPTLVHQPAGLGIMPFRKRGNVELTANDQCISTTV